MSQLQEKTMKIVPVKTQAPVFSSWTVGIIVSVFAGLIPLGKLADLTNIGTMWAFIAVSIGIIVLRKTRPNLKRAFKAPFVPVIPIMSVLFIGYLMIHLSRLTWIGFTAWFLLGLAVYFLYGRNHSELAKVDKAVQKIGNAS